MNHRIHVNITHMGMSENRVYLQLSPFSRDNDHSPLGTMGTLFSDKLICFRLGFLLGNPTPGVLAGFQSFSTLRVKAWQEGRSTD